MSTSLTLHFLTLLFGEALLIEGERVGGDETFNGSSIGRDFSTPASALLGGKAESYVGGTEMAD